MIPTNPELTTEFTPNIAHRGPDPLSPDAPQPAKLTTRQVDSMIAAAFGVSFIFAPIVNRLLPQSYGARVRAQSTPSTPSTRLAGTLEESGCIMPDDPDCETCDDWWTCAQPQELSE